MRQCPACSVSLRGQARDLAGQLVGYVSGLRLMRFAQCVNEHLLPESLRAPLSDFLPPRPPRPVPRVGTALSRLTGGLGGIVVAVVPQRRRKRRVDARSCLQKVVLWRTRLRCRGAFSSAFAVKARFRAGVSVVAGCYSELAVSSRIGTR